MSEDVDRRAFLRLTGLAGVTAVLGPGLLEACGGSTSGGESGWRLATENAWPLFGLDYLDGDAGAFAGLDSKWRTMRGPIRASRRPRGIITRNGTN